MTAYSREVAELGEFGAEPNENGTPEPEQEETEPKEQPEQEETPAP